MISPSDMNRQQIAAMLEVPPVMIGYRTTKPSSPRYTVGVDELVALIQERSQRVEGRARQRPHGLSGVVVAYAGEYQRGC